MRQSKGTFLLEFCVAIPWIVIAAILMSSGARHILPNSDKVAVQAAHPGDRAVGKNVGLTQGSAPRAFASTPPARVSGQDRPFGQKTARPVGRKSDLERPSHDEAGALKTSPVFQEDLKKTN